MNFQPLSDAACLVGRERLVQRCQFVGVEVVHHQHDLVGVWVQILDQPRATLPQSLLAARRWVTSTCCQPQEGFSEIMNRLMPTASGHTGRTAPLDLARLAGAGTASPISCLHSPSSRQTRRSSPSVVDLQDIHRTNELGVRPAGYHRPLQPRLDLVFETQPHRLVADGVHHLQLDQLVGQSRSASIARRPRWRSWSRPRRSAKSSSLGHRSGSRLGRSLLADQGCRQAPPPRSAGVTRSTQAPPP